MPRTPSQANLPTVEPTIADCVYAAGFLDGEACVAIYGPGKSGTAITPVVTVAQKTPEVLEWLADRWGGRPVLCATPRGGRAPFYKLDWTHARAEAVAKAIEPFVIVKRAQVANLLAYCEYKRAAGRRPYRSGRTVPDDAAAFIAASSSLNQKGPRES